MSSFDVEQLLEIVSDDAPAGENLEYDPEFGALEIAAQGKPEQSMGDEVKAAEEPDWEEVKNLALGLLSRTRDLRIAIHLTTAATHLDGFAGLAQGLRLTNGLIEDFWGGLYPELDADDDDDPTLRINSLLPLADSAMVAGAARNTPMVSSTILGKFSLRDYLIAKGDLTPTNRQENEPLPEMSHIDGAFMEAEIDDIVATGEALGQSIQSITAIETNVTERVGAVNSPDLGGLSSVLKEIKAVVDDHLARRGVGDGAEADGESGAPSGSGAINSRADVVRMLDRICDYFTANEPTSPVPLYLRRAQRMVGMDFLDILREMTPDGVHQAETVFGVRNDE